MHDFFLSSFAQGATLEISRQFVCWPLLKTIWTNSNSKSVSKKKNIYCSLTVRLWTSIRLLASAMKRSSASNISSYWSSKSITHGRSHALRRAVDAPCAWRASIKIMLHQSGLTRNKTGKKQHFIFSKKKTVKLKFNYHECDECRDQAPIRSRKNKTEFKRKANTLEILMKTWFKARNACNEYQELTSNHYLANEHLEIDKIHLPLARRGAFWSLYSFFNVTLYVRLTILKLIHSANEKKNCSF